MEAIRLVKGNDITGIGMKVIANLVIIPLVRFTVKDLGSGENVTKKSTKEEFFTKNSYKFRIECTWGFYRSKNDEKKISGTCMVDTKKWEI